MAESTEQPKIIMDLKKHPTVIVEGVVHTLTPITTVDNIEKELTKQIEMRLKKSKTDELVLMEIARNVEFLTSNNFIIFFTINNAHDTFVIAKEFAGGIMEHTEEKQVADDDPDSEDDYKIITVTTKVYIPDGYVGARINIKEFPKINEWKYFIWPKIKNMGTKQSYVNYGGFYHRLHPHAFNDGRLCSGQKDILTFNIDNILAGINSVIDGNIEKDKKTATILSYNSTSPVPGSSINDCHKGIHAMELFEQLKDNDKVTEQLIGGD